MDDLGKVIAFLVIAGLILYGIIMLIILLIPFIISGTIIYFEGKKFRSQMGKYQLTTTSKLTLAAIGAASLCVSAIFALTGHYPPYMIVPLSVVAFLTLSIVTLGLWAAIKLYPVQNGIEEMKRERNKLSRELIGIRNGLSAQNRIKGQLSNKFTSELEKRRRIEGQLRDFCMGSDHPRVFISLKERIEREARGLTLEELRSRLAALRNPQKQKERREAVELCVLKLENLNKENHNLHQRVDECDREIERISQEKEEKERTVSNLNEAIQEKENALQAYKNQRIVLN